jgi:hypothetical protein
MIKIKQELNSSMTGKFVLWSLSIKHPTWQRLPKYSIYSSKIHGLPYLSPDNFWVFLKLFSRRDFPTDTQKAHQKPAVAA